MKHIQVNDNFILDLSSFHQTDIVFETEHIKLIRGIYNNQKLLLHSFPINAFSSPNLSKFISLALFLSSSKLELFMQIYGIGFFDNHIFVAYIDDNLQKVQIENLELNDKVNIFKDSIMVLKILDMAGFNYNNLKVSSIFYDSNKKYKFGCFLPYSIIYLNSEDIKLFYVQEKLDILMLGLLIAQLFTGMNQTQILDKYWEFTNYLPDDMPYLSLIKECLSLAPVSRPSVEDLCKQVIVDQEIEKPEFTPLSEDELIHIYSKFSSRDPIFYVLLGSISLEKKNKKTAFNYFQQSSSLSISKNNLALILSSHDQQQAFNLMKAAADTGYAVAQYNLAHFYSKGIGVEIDSDKYLEYFILAADQGHIDAIRRTTQILRKKHDVAYRKYAFNGCYRGDMKCLIYTFLQYDEGYGRDENEVGAKEICRSAALMGSCLMCNYYSDWMKYEKNFEEAFKYALMGSQLGSRESDIKVAFCYLEGKGTEKNLEEGAKYMKKASDKGLAEAMFNYAAMLKDGIGVEKDEMAANVLCIMASRQRETNLIQTFNSEEYKANTKGEFHRPVPYNYFLRKATHSSDDDDE
ncbi:hypothetical protein TRFO_32575 [Tritrichomonas foetus]|uniref:Protein kinase domain-containing protein n=1 Tax=Tritrichomonas foetus TaxID=1144522 RepID=A0A1J4JPJ6_9EUKA|nr:hypothetical protein TRFO_32575 [Tritrichomonas foetus]|eukprot:OHT00666.1 hypothetical protein TRFO_32575 [Tritrichomonas foetus]